MQVQILSLAYVGPAARLEAVKYPNLNALSREPVNYVTSYEACSPSDQHFGEANVHLVQSTLVECA
jgi:hypothetical protein